MLILELLAVPFVVAGVAWVVEKLAMPGGRVSGPATRSREVTGTLLTQGPGSDRT